MLSVDNVKKSIIEALGLSYLELAKSNKSPLLQRGQTLLLAGCFSGSANGAPTVLSGDSSLQTIDQTYRTNACEADMRIWRHAMTVEANRILIYSPDQVVILRGLGLPNCHEQSSSNNRLSH